MAEPGDPQDTDARPDPHPDDHDDLVGFSSAASLEGRAREPEPGPEPEPEPLREPEPELERDPGPVPEADLFDAPPPRRERAEAPRPARAESIFEPSPEFAARSRARQAPVQDPPGGGMGLYAVYALILFAVPTLGVSALFGLFAVSGRDEPEDDLSWSHYLYQKRTLWAATIVAIIGVVLVPFGILALGVGLLFVLALWTVLRGAAGVWNLKSGKPISDPRGWWI